MYIYTLKYSREISLSTRGRELSTEYKDKRRARMHDIFVLAFAHYDILQ